MKKLAIMMCALCIVSSAAYAATAADKVVLEVEEIVEPGKINPEQVQLPGVFVDYVVHCPEEVIL